MDGEQEAYLVALSCSEVPQGHNRWSLRLLANKMVELNHVAHVSPETVRQVLKKTLSNPGSVKNDAFQPNKTRPLFVPWKRS